MYQFLFSNSVTSSTCPLPIRSFTIELSSVFSRIHCPQCFLSLDFICLYSFINLSPEVNDSLKAFSNTSLSHFNLSARSRQLLWIFFKKKTYLSFLSSILYSSNLSNGTKYPQIDPVNMGLSNVIVSRKVNVILEVLGGLYPVKLLWYNSET